MSGEIPIERTVKCDRCGYVYPYLEKIHAQGSGDSILWLDNDGAQRRARERANEDLRRQMERVEDRPVFEKCPKCDMYSKAETERRISSRRRAGSLPVPSLD